MTVMRPGQCSTGDSNVLARCTDRSVCGNTDRHYLDPANSWPNKVAYRCRK